MIFRETDYPAQYTVIETFDHNISTTINSIVRPLMINNFSNLDLTEEFTLPNCIAPCTYNNQKSMKLGCSNSPVIEAYIGEGIFIIHEVTLEMPSYYAFSFLNDSSCYFDTTVTGTGTKYIWAAARYTYDTESANFNDGSFELGFFSDIDNYKSDPDDYCIFGRFKVTVTDGTITYIELEEEIEDGETEEINYINKIDDGWLTPIPSRFLNVS